MIQKWEIRENTITDGSVYMLVLQGSDTAAKLLQKNLEGFLNFIDAKIPPFSHVFELNNITDDDMLEKIRIRIEDLISQGATETGYVEPEASSKSMLDPTQVPDMAGEILDPEVEQYVEESMAKTPAAINFEDLNRQSAAEHQPLVEQPPKDPLAPDVLLPSDEEPFSIVDLIGDTSTGTSGTSGPVQLASGELSFKRISNTFSMFDVEQEVGDGTHINLGGGSGLNLKNMTGFNTHGKTVTRASMPFNGMASVAVPGGDGRAGEYQHSMQMLDQTLPSAEKTLKPATSSAPVIGLERPAAVEPPAPAPKEKKGGFLSRLFGKKKKEEAPVPAPQPMPVAANAAPKPAAASVAQQPKMQPQAAAATIQPAPAVKQNISPAPLPAAVKPAASPMPAASKPVITPSAQKSAPQPSRGAAMVTSRNTIITSKSKDKKTPVITPVDNDIEANILSPLLSSDEHEQSAEALSAEIFAPAARNEELEAKMPVDDIFAAETILDLYTDRQAIGGEVNVAEMIGGSPEAAGELTDIPDLLNTGTPESIEEDLAVLNEPLPNLEEIQQAVSPVAGQPAQAQAQPAPAPVIEPEIKKVDAELRPIADSEKPREVHEPEIKSSGLMRPIIEPERPAPSQDAAKPVIASGAPIIKSGAKPLSKADSPFKKPLVNEIKTKDSQGAPVVAESEKTSQDFGKMAQAAPIQPQAEEALEEMPSEDTFDPVANQIFGSSPAVEDDLPTEPLFEKSTAPVAEVTAQVSAEDLLCGQAQPSEVTLGEAAPQQDALPAEEAAVNNFEVPLQEEAPQTQSAEEIRTQAPVSDIEESAAVLSPRTPAQAEDASISQTQNIKAPAAVIPAGKPKPPAPMAPKPITKKEEPSVPNNSGENNMTQEVFDNQNPVNNQPSGEEMENKIEGQPAQSQTQPLDMPVLSVAQTPKPVQEEIPASKPAPAVTPLPGVAPVQRAPSPMPAAQPNVAVNPVSKPVVAPAPIAAPKPPVPVAKPAVPAPAPAAAPKPVAVPAPKPAVMPAAVPVPPRPAPAPAAAPKPAAAPVPAPAKPAAVPDSAEKTKTIDHTIHVSAGQIYKRSNWPLEIPLIPTFTFDTMDMASNRFSHANAMSVVENIGTVYNPFFIYGEGGSGKTHFLHAMGYELSKKIPQEKIFITNGVRFARGIQRYVEEGKIAKLEEIFNSAQVIIIDDIHLTAVNEHNREVISKVLNRFLNERKQIIISSKYPPESLARFEELVDFKLDQGWVSELKPPRPQHFTRIYNKMVEHASLGLSEVQSQEFFGRENLTLGKISRDIRRVKVLHRRIYDSGSSERTYEELLTEMLAINGENPHSEISKKEFTDVISIPKGESSEWGSFGFFFPQDQADKFKWVAYATMQKAKELGIKGGFHFALKSSYSTENIISSAFKIANICDNKNLKGAIILGPSLTVCSEPIRENFYDIVSHMLEVMMIRCGIINAEHIKQPSTYIKVLGDVIK